MGSHVGPDQDPGRHADGGGGRSREAHLPPRPNDRGKSIFVSRNLGHTLSINFKISPPGGSGERGRAEVDRTEQGEIFSASKHLVHTGRKWESFKEVNEMSVLSSF